MSNCANGYLAGQLTRRRLLGSMAGFGVSTTALALLAGCGGTSTTTVSTAAPAGTLSPPPGAAGASTPVGSPVGAQTTGVFGGVIKAATLSSPPTLDVMADTLSVTREATWFFLETLITYGEDYSIIPLLAEKWEISQDGKTYTFHLRKGVKFHNGKEMTADDVVASTKRFLDVTTRKNDFKILQGYRAKDPLTVEFTIAYPSIAFLDTLAFPLGYIAVMPKEIIQGKPAKSLTNQELIGTGPYKLVDWTPDHAIRLQRFADYKPLPGPRSGLGGGKIPYFDEVQLIPVPDTGARVAGLESGAYDYVASPPDTDYNRLKSNSQITPYINKNDTWVPLLFNHRDKLAGNLKFRQAVQAALDMEAIALAITGGNREFYLLQPSIWFPASPWYNDAGAKLYNQHDLAKAKQLLQESGYNGEEVVMVTNRNYDYMYKAILTASDQLKKGLGMNTKVDVVDWPAQVARWDSSTGWQISVTGLLSMALFAPDVYRSTLAVGGYKNQKLDEIFDQALKAPTLDERKAAFRSVQETFYNDAIMVKICDIFSLVALRSNIKGYAPWYDSPRFWSCWRAS